MGLPIFVMLREEREPAELKHLSRQRKRKQYAMPLVKSIEHGTEQTESPCESLGRCGVDKTMINNLL